MNRKLVKVYCFGLLLLSFSFLVRAQDYGLGNARLHVIASEFVGNISRLTNEQVLMKKFKDIENASNSSAIVRFQNNAASDYIGYESTTVFQSQQHLASLILLAMDMEGTEDKVKILKMLNGDLDSALDHYARSIGNINMWTGHLRNTNLTEHAFKIKDEINLARDIVLSLKSEMRRP